jgi:hypothetical protein
LLVLIFALLVAACSQDAPAPTAAPSATLPPPTATQTPLPATAAPTVPLPTATALPLPSATALSLPSATPLPPVPTATPLPAPSATSPLPLAAAAMAAPAPRAVQSNILYQLFDWGTDFQHQHPEYGPVGSVQFYLWDTLNPAADVYNWSRIDAGLAQEANLKVKLVNGQEAPKPVALMVFPVISSYPGWNAEYYDATPGWVYDDMDNWDPAHPRPLVNGRKVGNALQGCGGTAVLPAYDSELWRRNYSKFVRALGARYDGHPQVACVVANIGLDGETHIVKDYPCNWNELLDLQLGGVRHRFGQFMTECMVVYREAFPNTPVYVANAPGGSGTRIVTSERAAQLKPPVGLKNAGMWLDADSYQGYGGYAGMWDMINTYSMTLPIWVESKFDMGQPWQRYWAFLQGLHSHPTMMSVHPEYLTQSDPEWLRFVQEHLGVRINDTPDVWTVLRDFDYPLQSWGDQASLATWGTGFFGSIAMAPRRRARTSASGVATCRWPRSIPIRIRRARPTRPTATSICPST